jgi:hypothetical protein
VAVITGTYELGPGDGRVLVKTGRAGMAARAGHDLTIEGTLTLRGTARPVRLQVAGPAAGRYRGSAEVRQTDFGITPYSGFFGALKLKDEVTVEFEVELGTPVGD